MFVHVLQEQHSSVMKKGGKKKLRRQLVAARRKLSDCLLRIFFYPFLMTHDSCRTHDSCLKNTLFYTHTTLVCMLVCHEEGGKKKF